MSRTIRQSLNHAVTAYDRKQEALASRPKSRAHYNPYALGQYLIRAASVADDIAAGVCVADAVRRGFCDRLLTAVEKVMIADGHMAG